MVGGDRRLLVASRAGIGPTAYSEAQQVRCSVRLSYLAPDIAQAILDGRQPRGLTPDRLLAHSRLPLAWHDQRTALGFA